MVTRLEAKGAVTYAEGGRARLYSPTITREAAALRETESLLKRVYRGSVGMLVSTLAQGGDLTEDDIAELTAILRRRRRDKV